MTLGGLKYKIESWPNETMQFCLEDVFSWRGVYAEPAFELSTREVSKSENLEMINRCLCEEFMGWKGGEFTYHEYDDVHFECGHGSWSDGKYINNFLMNNAHNEAVRYIFCE